MRALTSPFAGVHRAAWGRHAKPESVSENAVLNAVQRVLLDEGLL